MLIVANDNLTASCLVLLTSLKAYAISSVSLLKIVVVMPISSVSIFFGSIVHVLWLNTSSNLNLLCFLALAPLQACSSDLFAFGKIV